METRRLGAMALCCTVAASSFVLVILQGNLH
jgi:hypothetical protein